MAPRRRRRAFCDCTCRRLRIWCRPKQRRNPRAKSCRTVSATSSTNSCSPTASSPTKACSTPSAMSACGIRRTRAAIFWHARARRRWSCPRIFCEYTLDSEPVKPPVARPVTERTIHGCIYAARSDVMAVCHHHAPAVLPFCVAGKPIMPVFHLGATIGEATPLWDQQDEFGDTNLLVANNDEGRFPRPRARPPSGGFDAPPWRDRRRRRLARTGRALDLPVPECRVSDARPFARRAGSRCIRKKRSSRAKATSLPGVLTKTWDFYHMRLVEAGRLPPRAAAKTAARRRRILAKSAASPQRAVAAKKKKRR